MFDDVSPIFLDRVENLRVDDKQDALLFALSELFKGNRTLYQFLNDYDACTKGDFSGAGRNHSEVRGMDEGDGRKMMEK